MKSNFLLRLAPVLTGLAIMSAGQSAFAVSTWVFGDNTPVSECTASEVTSATGCVATTADPLAPAVKGFAVSTIGAGTTFATATLTSYSGGLGVQANSLDINSPQHSIDNSGYTDAIVLSFGNMLFDLDQVKIGWKGNSTGGSTNADADLSIFRLKDGFSPTPVGSAATNAGLLAIGWELVGNYADLVTNTAKNVNTTNKTASWWMISAYNSSYGTASGADQGAANSGGTTGLQSGNDYFKVLSVAGTATSRPPVPGSVPEPGSLALVGAGLFGLVALRRRNQGNV